MTRLIISPSLVYIFKPRVIEWSQRTMVKMLLTSRRKRFPTRSEEHTSELQSQSNLVCRLLLEKKKRDQGERQFRRTVDACADIDDRYLLGLLCLRRGAKTQSRTLGLGGSPLLPKNPDDQGYAM